jgi:hypothetical protein
MFISITALPSASSPVPSSRMIDEDDLRLLSGYVRLVYEPYFFSESRPNWTGLNIMIEGLRNDHLLGMVQPQTRR